MRDVESLARWMYEASLPSSFFKDATYEAVVTDAELRRYLAQLLGLPGNTPPAEIQVAALKEAERRRGSELWIRFFDVPAEYPASEEDHQAASVLERIYLSAPGNYRKQALFRDHLMSQKRRDELIQAASLKLGSASLGAFACVGALAWLIKRRTRQHEHGGAAV